MGVTPEWLSESSETLEVKSVFSNGKLSEKVSKERERIKQRAREMRI